ncbi:GNAT family N-acetyltransferase [Kitasatospora sp. NPDC101157]|uniref:GNAT family N-acetyltransferase n=1 Tax=Kitasatospora sp. NPDC101157 TaxID=3364098 RepID=UPI00382E9BCF
MRELELSDGVITLSPLRPEDAAAHLAGEDEALARWLGGGPSTPEGVAAYFRHCREEWETAGALRAFGIRADQGNEEDDADGGVGGGGNGVLAGTVDLRFEHSDLAPGQVNVAYGLYPSWRGRGLATRAVLLASGYAARAGAREAVIRVEPENAASAAVARRAGFRPAGRVRDGHGTLHDCYLRGLDL